MSEASLRHSPRVKRWLEILLGVEEGDVTALTRGAVRPVGLSEQEFRYVMTEEMRRRGQSVDQRRYDEAMDRLTPVLSVPRVTDPVGDMALTFLLPELRAFWHAWDGARPDGRRRRREYNPDGAKALLATLAIPGQVRHADDAVMQIRDNRPLRDLFGDLSADGSFRPASYQSALANAHELSPSCVPLALRANVELLRSLRAMPGHERIGVNLMVDATPFVAWAQQRAAGRSVTEHQLRAFAPDAALRAYSYEPGGKVDLAGMRAKHVAAAVRAARAKVWRGFLLCALVDQASGLPVVWNMIPADHDERQALKELLETLFGLWPDAPVETVAGDGLYNVDWVCRHLEVSYRRRPIFRLASERALTDAQRERLLDGLKGPDGRVLPRHYPMPGAHEQILGRLHDGRLLCIHGNLLDFEKFERPAGARELPPGVDAPDSGFRTRHVACPQCGGSQITVQAKHDWSTQTYFPKHPHGRPDLFAFAAASLHRLCGIEGLWSMLKTAHGIGVAGSDRQRIRLLADYEAIASLTLLSITGRTVYDQRTHRGLPLGPPAPPGDPAPDDQPGGGAVIDLRTARRQRLPVRASQPGGDAPEASLAPLPSAAAKPAGRSRLTGPPFAAAGIAAGPILHAPLLALPGRAEIGGWTLVPADRLNATDAVDRATAVTALRIAERLAAITGGPGLLIRPPRGRVGDPVDQAELAALRRALVAAVLVLAPDATTPVLDGQRADSDAARVDAHDAGVAPAVPVGTDGVTEWLDAEYAAAVHRRLADGAVRLGRAIDRLALATLPDGPQDAELRACTLRDGLDILFAAAGDPGALRQRVCALLDPADEACLSRAWTDTAGVPRRAELSDLGWWVHRFAALTDALRSGDHVDAARLAHDDGVPYELQAARHLRRAITATVTRDADAELRLAPARRDLRRALQRVDAHAQITTSASRSLRELP